MLHRVWTQGLEISKGFFPPASEPISLKYHDPCDPQVILLSLRGQWDSMGECVCDSGVPLSSIWPATSVYLLSILPLRPAPAEAITRLSWGRSVLTKMLLPPEAQVSGERDSTT